MVSGSSDLVHCQNEKDGWLAVKLWRARSGSKFRGTHRFMPGLVLLVALATVAAADEPAVENAPFLRVTTDGYFKQRPAWSPNGQHLVFARHRGATIFLFLRDLKSNQEERLTKSEHPEYDAIFAPNGKELLFAYDKASPNQGDIEVHQLDFESRKSKPVAISEGKLSHEESPCGSPDGKRIAFTSTRHGNQELYVSDADGKSMVRLTSDPAHDAHPHWSPNGKSIAFATNRWGDMEIALINPDGTDLTQVTHSVGLDDYPSWSPNGKRLAFTSNRDGNLEIYVLDTATGLLENATRSPAIDNFPAWTPDGRLGFVSNRDSGFDIHVTRGSAQE